MIRALVVSAAVLWCGAALAASESDLAPGAVIKDCADCPEMVVIPPGEFMMGTPMDNPEVDMTRGEGPQVKVTIGKKFALAKYEVTQALFKNFIDATGHEMTEGCRIWGGDAFTESETSSWDNPAQPQTPLPEHPVACVSWNEAQAFVKWLSEKTGQTYRLATVSEWEYAARAGTTTSRFWGDDPNEACAWANVYDQSSRAVYPFPFDNAQCDDGFSDLAPVGSFKPNAFGLYDMIGNVWEWTEDCYAGSHQGRPKDGRAWTWDGGCENHDIRGGGWMTAPPRNRLAWPGRDPADRHANFFGFRVARDLDAPYQREGAQLRRLTLYTADVARAKKFWVDALGYRIQRDLPGFGGEDMARRQHLNPAARVHFVIMEPGNLESGGGGPLIGLLGAEGQTLEPLDRSIDAAPKAGDHIIVVKVPDIAHTFDVLHGMGVTVIEEPEHLSGATGVQGMEGSVLSPDGTRVLIQQIEAE